MYRANSINNTKLMPELQKENKVNRNPLRAVWLFINSFIISK